jgi:hypothetical protein
VLYYCKRQVGDGEVVGVESRRRDNGGAL